MASEALTSELANDPLERGYAAMSDAEIADSLNARDVGTVGAIDPILLRQRLVMMPCEADPAYPLIITYWRALANAAPDQEDELAVGRWRIANTLIAAYDARVPVNLGNAEVSSAATTAVALGLITEAQLALLVGDATTLTSRAEALGIGPVSHEQVAGARV